MITTSMVLLAVSAVALVAALFLRPLDKIAIKNEGFGELVQFLSDPENREEQEYFIAAIQANSVMRDLVAAGVVTEEVSLH